MDRHKLKTWGREDVHTAWIKRGRRGEGIKVCVLNRKGRDI